jgi:hypothetical protein
MHIRKKKNRSGSTSIVAVDKSSGKYKEMKTIGTATEKKALKRMSAFVLLHTRYIKNWKEY